MRAAMSRRAMSCSRAVGVNPSARIRPSRNAATHVLRTTLGPSASALLYFETLGQLGKLEQCVTPCLFVQQRRWTVVPPVRGWVGGQVLESHELQVWLFGQGLQGVGQTFVCAEARGGSART